MLTSVTCLQIQNPVHILEITSLLIKEYLINYSFIPEPNQTQILMRFVLFSGAGINIRGNLARRRKIREAVKKKCQKGGKEKVAASSMNHLIINTSAKNTFN